MILSFRIIGLLMIILLISLPVLSQRRIDLVNADEFEGGRRDGKRYNKFIGNVHFIQGSTEIWCDSAFLYKRENSLEAFGHVRIFDTIDSVNITSERLEYDGDSRVANLRKNVVYKEDSVILTTDFLDYNIHDRSAYFFNQGTINDGENILTSDRGYYNSTGKTMAFKTDVVLVNPENNLKTDSLFYNMATKIATTIGPTDILSSDGSTVHTEEGGIFNMRVNQTVISSGEIETESYILRGDELFYDPGTGSNSARGNVYMFSKDDNIVITGDAADNFEDVGITRVFGNALMKKVFELDTLYLTADTLVSVDDSLDANKRLLAFRHVQFFREDLQGKSDSLAYFLADSILHLYNDPVIWSEGNQIEADSINIVFENDQISTLNLIENSFMIMLDTADNFNQLKGKLMTGYFENNDIDRLVVTGNSESLFYALDEEDNSLIGINKTLCSNMIIRFKENRASNISFYVDVESTFIPPHELEEPDTRLKGFNWRGKEKPVLSEMLNPPEAPPSLPVENDPLQVPLGSQLE
ncbi:MAG: Organic solvent tolerance protein OstA [Cyclobacteriaceae bacterium]|nr:Organic solvent tolerance protein OstA [Cyclobacteriaceae bacterium]